MDWNGCGQLFGKDYGIMYAVIDALVKTIGGRRTPELMVWRGRSCTVCGRYIIILILYIEN